MFFQTPLFIDVLPRFLPSSFIGSFTTSGTFITGYTATFDCQSGCFGMVVYSVDRTQPFHARFTVNSLEVFNQNLIGSDEVFVIVNGATGAFAINGNPAGCTLSFK